MARQGEEWLTARLQRSGHYPDEGLFAVKRLRSIRWICPLRYMFTRLETRREMFHRGQSHAERLTRLNAACANCRPDIATSYAFAYERRSK